ncbi:54S ribosomal protein L28, mitochondrial [Wickerhamomyces ciferrii]|uniref:Large ribosomal subunit protein mL40 n=1 Tax=Wickerhamomyces ciferrii (strain ATCC 14091 / BCRC 22168 / CBS 111 / JCM 3599 / NBRC 0793 / NRRL Y-1031 F-60-10) TaxID=1206466 RepID=K0KVQ3_WICCF|nr:54S ribosomal protein L28, mitochondrial [Wickerhamomyces ciferrii]CCH45569.1 54S ribosomal protein L28, mitochondrial [Wickerhamomyces ciferrii]
MLRSSAKSSIQTLSRGFLSAEQIPSKSGPIQFVRGKRTKKVSSISPQTQKIITQLSVLSARKKVPRVLKLSNEDLVRHDAVQRAWGVYQKDKRIKNKSDLAKQYEAMNNAMTDLKSTNRELYDLANVREVNKKFPLEFRIPTHFPPNKVWYYDYVPKDETKTTKEN